MAQCGGSGPGAIDFRDLIGDCSITTQSWLRPHGRYYLTSCYADVTNPGQYNMVIAIGQDTLTQVTGDGMSAAAFTSLSECQSMHRPLGDALAVSTSVADAQRRTQGLTALTAAGTRAAWSQGLGQCWGLSTQTCPNLGGTANVQVDGFRHTASALPNTHQVQVSWCRSTTCPPEARPGGGGTSAPPSPASSYTFAAYNNAQCSGTAVASQVFSAGSCAAINTALESYYNGRTSVSIRASSGSSLEVCNSVPATPNPVCNNECSFWYEGVCQANGNAGQYAMVTAGPAAGSSSDDDNTVVIIGAAAGGVVVILLVIVVIVFLNRKPAARTPVAPQAAGPGVPMQPAQQMQPAGTKFDPVTGQPLAKFDPVTGQPIANFDPVTGARLA